MFHLCRDSQILLNLTWVEALQTLHTEGKIFLPWGNDPVVVTPGEAEGVGRALSRLQPEKRRLRTFYSFRWENTDVMVDLAEVKVVELRPTHCILFRRYEDHRDLQVSIQKGESVCVDRQEWELLCDEFCQGQDE